MAIKKGYDNPTDWYKIEKDNQGTIIINQESVNENVDSDNDDSDNDGSDDGSEGYFDDVELVEDEGENKNNENFDEVLELTQYEDSLLPSKNDNLPNVVAVYDDIKPVELEQKHKLAAKSFVSKITKFVLEFNDIQLSEAHKKYIREVGKLQLQHLEDLLYLVDVNKQMLNNIIHRVNATQAEDYVIINSYNNLTNQHIKLIKELSNTYRSIPNVLKKMRSDVLCNQELDGPGDNEPISETFGENQFNSSKQFLRSLLDKRKEKQENTNDSTNSK